MREVQLVCPDIDEFPWLQVLLLIRHHAEDLVSHADQCEEQQANGDANQPSHGGILSA